jgi:hypothetical protein
MTDKKPGGQSVTGEPCTCRFLEGISGEKDSPIVFDAELQEYQLRWPGSEKGSGPIYHCPFCGGKAPRSKRASLFAQVSMGEVMRLRDLTRGLATVPEAIAALGQPQEDIPDGMVIQTPESADEPSKASSYRMLKWAHLSEVADVHLIDYGPHGVKFTFNGKYLGERAGGPTSGCS